MCKLFEILFMKKNNFISLIKNQYYIPFLFLLFLGLLTSRRWQQLLSPQVWDEDGAQILYGFITNGWYNFFEPVNGYLITVPKIISFVSLNLSFSQYPAISTLITWLFIAAVGVVIVLAPTQLHNKFLCAVFVFLIPSDPEVFGIPLYTFWWAALLLFLVALWDENSSSLLWRISFLVIVGLSSPIIIMILPVLYLRALWYRTLHSEIIIAITATFISLIQIYTIIKESAVHSLSIIHLIYNAGPATFGKFLIDNWVHHQNYLLFSITAFF